MPVSPVMLSLHNYHFHTSLEVTSTISNLKYENENLKHVYFSI
jgi:hypothetical protein